MHLSHCRDNRNKVLAGDCIDYKLARTARRGEMMNLNRQCSGATGVHVTQGHIRLQKCKLGCKLRFEINVQFF